MDFKASLKWFPFAESFKNAAFISRTCTGFNSLLAVRATTCRIMFVRGPEIILFCTFVTSFFLWKQLKKSDNNMIKFRYYSHNGVPYVFIFFNYLKVTFDKNLNVFFVIFLITKMEKLCQSESFCQIDKLTKMVCFIW